MLKKRDSSAALLTAAEVKTNLRKSNSNLKHWAHENGYSYETVSQVMRGVNRATFGQGYEIAKKLGMK